MRIAIDVSSAAKGDPTGIGRYIVELVRGISTLMGDDDRLALGVRWSRWKERAHLAPLAKLRGCSGPRLLLSALPGALIRGLDVLHATGMSAPALAGMPLAVTVHDISTIDDPSLMSKGFSASRTAKTAKVIDRADLIFVISAFVKERILAVFPRFPADRIRVTHLGIDHAGLSAEPTARDGETRARLGLDAKASEEGGRPYVLFVGRVEHRKNPEGLVRAFALSREAKDHLLVFAGQDGRSQAQEAAREAGVTDRVRFLGRVEDADLGPLYRGARCFALPSRNEGFGIPLAEAFACGCPALASDQTALPEVAGGAAEITGIAPDAIAAGLDRLLGDAARRADLRAKGFARARDFTWRRTAEGTWAGYGDLLRLGKR